MKVRYHILLALVGASIIIGGGYKLANKAFDDGLHQGISAVVHQCANQHTTIYNGETGEVMVCDGATLTKPETGPENGLKTPPRAIQPPAGQSGIYEDPKEQSI